MGSPTAKCEVGVRMLFDRIAEIFPSKYLTNIFLRRTCSFSLTVSSVILILSEKERDAGSDVVLLPRIPRGLLPILGAKKLTAMLVCGLSDTQAFVER